MLKPSHFKYDDFETEWQKVINDPMKKRVGESWLHDDTVDAWRHERMRAPLRAIIAVDKDSSWLTVGDGRFGTDAHFLIKEGIKNVHCSDISDTLLKIGQEKGFINDYSAQNAENLSFPDNHFDYVYCKESLHHFPRPYVALDEMLRVARKAVVLTEPRDTSIDRDTLSLLKDFIKKLIGKKIFQGHFFEEIGNYIYSISEREIEKFLLGMHYSYVAFIGINDAYREGVEFISTNSKDVKDQNLENQLLKEIKHLDFLCKIGFRRSNILSAVLFKSKPSDLITKSLLNSKWDVKSLPKNPYFKLSN